MTTTTQSAWWRDRAGSHPLLTPEQEVTLGRQVQAWQVDPDNASPAVERRGRRARDRLVAANLRLAIVVAKRHARHAGGACGIEDLIQGGNLGLIRAAEKFDPSRGYRFSTYAFWWISQGVRAVIDRDSRTIRMPTTFASKLHAISAATQSLVMRLGREPSRDELAMSLGIPTTSLDALLTVGSRCASLDRIISDTSETTFADALAAPADPDNDDEQLQDLRARVDRLPPQFARLITARYHQRIPASELAAQEGLTPAELRKKLKAAVNMLAMACIRSQAPSLTDELIMGDQLALFQESPAPSACANRKVPGRAYHRPTSPAIQALQCSLLPV